MSLRKQTLTWVLAMGAGLGLRPLAAAETPAAPPGATVTPASSLSEQDVQAMDNKVRELHELFNRLELQAEATRSQIDRAKPQPVSFGSGELKLMNSMAFPTAQTLSGTASPSTFSSLSGIQALIGINLNPAAEVTGNIQFELLGPVAVDRLLPQKEKDLYAQGKYAIVRKAEIKFEDDYVLTRAFRAVPRPDLYEEGDMFYLFPAADDQNTYFRQSGRAVPNGFQFLAKDGLGIAKGFEVWAGDELTYGTVPEVFARYKRHVGSVDFSLMGDWQDDVDRTRGAAVWARQEGWVRLPLWAGQSVDLVAARQAGQVGQTYNVVDQVAAGTGTLGTNYLVTQKTTTESDAWAGLIRLRGQKDIPFVEEESLTGAYGGPLAVNIMKVEGLVSVRPQRFLLVSVEGGYQKPVVGVNPTVILGSPGLSFGIMPGTGPRPYGSPVSVTDDIITGQNNREMNWVATTFEYNPGQGWFYKYRPRIVDDWNFNSDLKTPFSSALSVRLFNCPTGTDLGRYFDATGKAQPEPLGSSGKAPSNGWLYDVKDITSVALGPVQTWLELGTGQQMAGLSYNNTVVPANTYFVSSLSAKVRGLTLSGGYAEDIYGPDDWYRNDGVLIGNRFTAGLVYAVGNSDISIQYQGWRDKPNTDHPLPAIPVTYDGGTVVVQAPIDQVMTTYTIRF